MEKQIKLKTKGGYYIYGTHTVPSKKADTLVIFVHGLGGDRNEHIFFNATKYLVKKGIATFRLSLYSWDKGARRLSDCTIETHAQDINQAVGHFRRQYKKIILIGHSLGALAILLSDTTRVDGIVLWDPSHSKCLRKEGLKFKKKLDTYILDWGVEILLGKKMFNEWKTIPNSNELIEKVQVPIKIVAAEKGILVSTSREYFKHANKPKAFAIIKAAGHNFDEWGTGERFIILTNHTKDDATPSEGDKKLIKTFQMQAEIMNKADFADYVIVAGDHYWSMRNQDGTACHCGQQHYIPEV